MASLNLLTVGATEQRCPYCRAALETFPQKAMNCPSCEARINVATRLGDGARVLLTEDERIFVGGRWKPFRPSEREGWIRRNKQTVEETRAYHLGNYEQFVTQMKSARADGLDSRMTIQAGDWSCEVGHAVRGVEFGLAELPLLPLPHCPFTPHCFCTYGVGARRDRPPDTRTKEQREAELDASICALTRPAADEVIRMLNAALGGFGIGPYVHPADRG